MEYYNSYIEIDCKILCKNIQSIHSDLGPEVELIPVLKCDAYGLGAEAVAKDIVKSGAKRGLHRN